MPEKWKPSIVRAVEWRSEVGVGASGAVFVTLDAVGKFDVDPAVTACVAAEYVCNRLAIACGLPVPGASLTRRADGTAAFTSIRFGSLTQLPAPVVAADLAAALGLETHTVQTELEAAVKAHLTDLADLKPRLD